MAWETHSEMIKRENQELIARVLMLEQKVASLEANLKIDPSVEDLAWLFEWSKSVTTTAPIDFTTRITST